MRVNSATRNHTLFVQLKAKSDKIQCLNQSAFVIHWHVYSQSQSQQQSEMRMRVLKLFSGPSNSIFNFRKISAPFYVLHDYAVRRVIPTCEINAKSHAFLMNEQKVKREWIHTPRPCSSTQQLQKKTVSNFSHEFRDSNLNGFCCLQWLFWWNVHFSFT